jgi:hypothetical protein
MTHNRMQIIKIEYRYYWKRCFLFGPCKMVIKKSSIEKNQSSSGVPSEQLVENCGSLLSRQSKMIEMRWKRAIWQLQFRIGLTVPESLT